MRASTCCAHALIAVAVLGLANQAQGQETAFGDADDNQTAVDEDPCVANLYTENCTGSCTMAGTCNNKGRCRGNTGLCECFAGSSGAHCETTETADGGGADPCVKDKYTEGCTAQCSMAITCNNEGRCLGDGSCLCFEGFSGAHCDKKDDVGDPCVKNMY
jgi:hypothetical protein